MYTYLHTLYMYIYIYIVRNFLNIFIQLNPMISSLKQSCSQNYIFSARRQRLCCTVCSKCHCPIQELHPTTCSSRTECCCLCVVIQHAHDETSCVSTRAKMGLYPLWCKSSIIWRDTVVKDFRSSIDLGLFEIPKISHSSS